MRIACIALLVGVLAGCGSGGGVSGNTVDPGSGPAATKARVTIGTRAVSVETIIYGIDFLLNLPTGVTVPALPETGAVLPGVLEAADSRALAGATYMPATSTTPGRVRVIIADPSGFTVGNLAALNCTISAGVTVDPSGFTIPGFLASDQNGLPMSGVTSHLSVQMQ